MCTLCGSVNHIAPLIDLAASSSTTDSAASSKPVWSVEQIATYLTTGYWDDKGSSTRKFDITSSDTLTVNLSGLSNSSLTYARAALQAWTDASGITFTETTSSTAQIKFTDSYSGAYTWSLYSNGETISSNVNIYSKFASSAYMLQTYIHEIGHALGLGHSGDYNSSASFSTDADYANDTWQYSIMSYFYQSLSSDMDASFAYVVTPQIADILAIQQLYGTSDSVHSGNTTYGDSGVTLLDARAQTIVDASGIDTIDISARSADQRIDLTPGSFSDLGGKDKNLAIALDTVVENVYTGSGDDDITGNTADNIILSGAGDDIVAGGEGADWLAGQDGNDSLSGEAGDDTLIGGDGSDTLDGGNGDDTAVYEQLSDDVFVYYTSSEVLIKIGDDIDALSNIETVAFTDGSYNVADLTELEGAGWIEASSILDGTAFEPTAPETSETSDVTAPQADTASDTLVTETITSIEAHMEVGVTSLSRVASEDGWVTVSFASEINDAIVVVGPITTNGGDPLVPEIRNVTSTGFEIRITEWDYLDGSHTTEKISWMAGSAGSYYLADGTQITFGSSEISGTDASTIALDGFDSSNTVSAYGSLIGTGDEVLTHRLTSVSSDELSVQMQTEEAKNGSHATEARTFDYVIIENGGNLVENGVTSLASSWVSIGGTNSEAVFADMQTANGIDTASVRQTTKNGATYLKVAEEQSADGETAHAQETVAYTSLSTGTYSLSTSEPTSYNATNSALEIGSISLNRDGSEDGWVHVTFSEVITDAVVVLGPITTNGSDPVTAELRNITDEGFDVRLSEWDYLDGDHTTETISWMAGTEGQHMLSDGTKITLGTQEITGRAAVDIAYEGFDETPTILASVSGEGGQTVTERIGEVDSNSATLRLSSQEADGNVGNDTTRVVQWVAIETASESIISEGTEAITHIGSKIAADSSLALFGDSQSYNGSDTMVLRTKEANDGTSLYIQEEQSKDSEMIHMAETVSWLTIEEGRHDLIDVGDATVEEPLVSSVLTDSSSLIDHLAL
ncbi:M10 family metallopeptidase [Thioclava kandeliae]|uniref:M10 family metallopeptidase n=1 Tax=Thioclava kandeliae TaxID=3070818 RepID=A0ABV1SMC0_9RHOB